MAKNKLKHPRDISNMTDEQIVALIVDDFKQSEAHLSEQLNKCRNYYAQYRSIILSENVRTTGANLFVPYTFQLIETSVPKWFNALFGTKPYTTILPAGENSAEAKDRAKKLNELVTYQLDQRIKIVAVGNDILKSVAIYGLAVTKQEWVIKTRKVTRKEQAKLDDVIPVPGAYKMVEKEVKVKDDPSMRMINIINFRFDPTGCDIDSCRWVGEENDVDLAEIQNKIDLGIYKQTKELKEYIDNLRDAPAKDYGVGENSKAVSGRQKKNIKVQEYYTDEWRIHIIDNRFLALKERNPFWHGKKPYTRWVAISVPGEFYGISIPECVESLQYELNTTRNQRIDNVSMAINRMWKVLRGSNVREEQLISRPNGIIWVDNENDVTEVQMTNVTENAYREEMEIKNDMDMASGVVDSIRGTSTDRRETATTASIMHQSGGDRFQYETTLLDVTGLIDAIGQIVELNQQFVTEDKYMNLQGEDEATVEIHISPDDLLGQFDVVAASRGTDPVANKEVQRNQLITLKQTLADDPYVNQMELTKRILEAFDMKDIDSLLVEQPPMQQQPPLQNGLPTDMMGMAGGLPQENPLDTATPDQIQMVLQAIESGGELPPELLPLAEALVQEMQMQAQEGGVI